MDAGSCPTSRKPRELGHPKVLCDGENWATRPTVVLPDSGKAPLLETREKWGTPRCFLLPQTWATRPDTSSFGARFEYSGEDTTEMS